MRTFDIISDARLWGRQELLAAGLASETVSLDVDVLLCAAMECAREKIILDQGALMLDVDKAQFISFITRRARNEPVAYIIGVKEFWSLEFCVTPDVLIPRPETELVVEKALSIIKESITKIKEQITIIDIGTGSGAIAIAVATECKRNRLLNWPDDVKIIALDVSGAALEVAKLNAARLGVLEQIHFYVSDVLTSEVLKDVLDEHLSGSVIFVSNPPYVSDNEQLPVDVDQFEPMLALRSGCDGLSCITKVVEQIAHRAKHTKAHTLWLVMEIGETQSETVSALCVKYGFDNVSVLKDYADKPRIILASIAQAKL